MTTTQANWRICTRCYALFYYGEQTAGICPLGGPHNPFGSGSVGFVGDSWDIELTVDGTALPAQHPGGGAGSSPTGYQGNWRFCSRCFSLFWYGHSTAGLCPFTRGDHIPLKYDVSTLAGLFSVGPSGNYLLRANDSQPPSTAGPGSEGADSGYEGNWRFCTKCYCLFFYGYPYATYAEAAAGACQGGGPHSPFQADSPTGAGTSGDYEVGIASHAVAQPPHPATPNPDFANRLYGNQRLLINDQITSDKNEVYLILQDDGNLVLYRRADGHPLWSTETTTMPVTSAVLQYDGNFVLYDSSGAPRWATGTDGEGAHTMLVPQDDHNLVL